MVDIQTIQGQKRRNFLPWFVATAAAVYVLVCLSLSTLLLATHRERIFDVTNFPDSMARPDLTGAYLSATVTTDTVLFAGSSFTFGYTWAAPLAFPSVFAQETGRPTVNVSVIGATTLGIKQSTICEMERRALRAKVIVLEIPVINEFGFLAGLRPGAPQDGPCQSETPLRLLPYIATHPNGRAWLSHLRDEYAAYNYDYPDVQIVQVPDTYFASRPKAERVLPIVRTNVSQLIERSRRVADSVYAFVTPVYVSGVEKAGQNPQNVEWMLEHAKGMCRDALGDRCIDTTAYYTRRDMWWNLSHLSIKGNADFARYLATHVR